MYTFNITCFVSILQPSMCCFCISNFEQITYWDGIGDTMDKHPHQPSPWGGGWGGVFRSYAWWYEKITIYPPHPSLCVPPVRRIGTFPLRGSPWDNKCTTISQHLWYNAPRAFMFEDKPCDVSLSLEKLADGRRGFLTVWMGAESSANFRRGSKAWTDERKQN